MGRADRQGDLFDDVVRFCEGSLPENSIYGFLARERDRLFPDELFDDLFEDSGRRSVPPSVVATVMVLQRLGGLSDREAVERYAFDVRWRYAAGVGGYGGGWGSFAHTVLVDMRARLRRSTRPDRIFEVGLEAAHAAGLVGRRRVLDSTPLYDAVATMDTITLIRSAVRGLLTAADADLAAALRAALSSGEDYVGNGKPQIDWDDRGAREQLIDSRARDGFAMLALLDGRELAEAVEQAASLLATVLGQDLETGPDGVFRGQVVHDGPVAALGRDRQHPLDHRGIVGGVQRGVAEQRPDRGQPGVAGAHAVAPLGLQVGQERHDQSGVQVGDVQANGLLAGRVRRVGDQQPQAVAVGGDGVRAGLALTAEPVGEEALQDRGERAHRRAPYPAFSSRSAAASSSSGVACRYQ